MRRLFFLFPMLVIVFLDQATKHWCAIHLEQNIATPFLDHVGYLTLMHNTRGAFSLFPLPIALFVGITSILLLGLLWFVLAADHSYRTQILAGLILGGGLGNLLDRIRLGYVVDFLDFRYWPVFNLADSAVSVGMILVILLLLRKPSAAS